MDFLRHNAGRLVDAWRRRTVALKAASFALVGVINAAVDYGVFFLARGLLRASAGALELAAAVAMVCGCLDAKSWILVPANVIAWLVAVSGSYVMNSYTTFALESGRTLRWRDYRRFVASGVAGVISNTATVVAAAQFAPLWLAKLLAIAVGFLVNFSLSNFVVFRTRDPASR